MHKCNWCQKQKATAVYKGRRICATDAVKIIETLQSQTARDPIVADLARVGCEEVYQQMEM